MSVFASIETWETTEAGSGTVDLPTNWNFTDTAPNENEEYDVVCIAGEGSLDQGTKTYTTFDVTVTAGPCTFRVYPRKLGALNQVA